MKFKVKDMPQFFELSEHWTLMFLLKQIYTRTKTNRRCNTGQLQYHWQIQNEVAPFVILKTCEAKESQVSFLFCCCYLQILYVKYSQNYSKGGFIPLKKTRELPRASSLGPQQGPGGLDLLSAPRRSQTPDPF